MKLQVLFFMLISIVVNRDILLDPLLTSNVYLSHYQCIRQSYDEVALWLGMTDKGVPPAQSQVIANAKNAGLKVTLGFYPCRSSIPEDQFLEILRAVGSIPIEHVFFEPILNVNTSCSWEKYSAYHNCQYLQNLVNIFNSKGFKTGVVANKSAWASTFGLDTSCPKVRTSLLAWVPADYEQNKQPNFEHYSRIGGWQEPYSKFYSSKNICGRVYFISYTPS